MKPRYEPMYILEPERTNPDNNMSYCEECGWHQEHPPVYGRITMTGNTVLVDHADHPSDGGEVPDPFSIHQD